VKKLNGLKATTDALWAGIIRKMDFNLLKHEIFFDVEVIENGVSSKHSVIFEDVASYFYSNNIEDKRLEIYIPDEEDYLEMTSIHYLEGGIGQIGIQSNSEPWAKQWHSSANFIIEIWSAHLFIEARTVIIDGEIFNVGFPGIR